MTRAGCLIELNGKNVRNILIFLACKSAVCYN